MPSNLFVGATEPRRMAVTVNEGVFADIVTAGVALRADPNDIPDPDSSQATTGDFVEIALDDPDVMPVFGPGAAGDLEPAADASGTNDLQIFLLLRTATFDFIRRPDVLTVLGNPAV